MILSSSVRKMQAQYDEKDFVLYTVQDGLSDNSIMCFQQDDYGYLWIGTENGLCRFDGYVFNNYFQDSKSLPLLGSQVYKLEKFESGKIGILSRGGFQLFDAKNFTLRNYILPDSTPFSLYLNRPSDVNQLNDHEFEIATLSGFYVFDISGQLLYRFDAYQPKDIGVQNIFYGRDIFTVSNHECLVYNGKFNLSLYDATDKSYRSIANEEEKWKPIHPGNRGPNATFIIRSQVNDHEFISIDYNDNVATYYDLSRQKTVNTTLVLPQNDFNWESQITFLSGNIFAVNAANFGFYIFYIERLTGKIIFNPQRYLSRHEIISLYPDNDGRLWVGTTKGLLCQKLNTPFIRSTTYPPSLSDSLTGGFSCAYRLGNKIFLGRYSSNYGLLIVDEETKNPERQIQFYGGNNKWNQIRSIQQYHPDTLWLGTDLGILWFDTKTYQYGALFNDNPGTKLTSLSQAGKDGCAWMTSFMNAKIACYNIHTRSFTFYDECSIPPVPFSKIKSLAKDAFGDIWLSGHSLARWNNEKQIYDTLISVYGGRNKYEDDILGLVADNVGSLWLFTPYNGLLEYRIKEKEFINYTTMDGLPSDIIFSISPVVNNDLWLAGNSTLASFDIISKKINVYDRQDGLPDDLASSRYLYFDSQRSVMYLLQNHTLSYFSVPVPQHVDYGTQIIIEALVINGKENVIYPKDQLKLKAGDKNLSLHFSLIDFEAGSNYQFSFKLNNNDNWTNLGNQRNITMTGLSAGHYNVQLKATGKSGRQKVASFAFSIATPFWRTYWFVSASIILVAGIGYYFYHRRIKWISQRANIDKMLSQTEMKALHAQMNPHFIFNSLNSIGEMILHNENDEATHFLGKFANLIRMTLDHSGQSFISLRNTMDYLSNYIEMEQIRNPQFTYRMNADNALDLDETILPPMLIQPFIENALWHGTTAKHKNIHINIDFKKSDVHLIASIDDNGRGIEQSLKSKINGDDLHHPVGISNIKNRIQLLNEKYGLKSSITIDDKSNLKGFSESGTLVIIRLPLEMNENG